MLVMYPRIILAEMNTHNIMSKNTSSSRAMGYHRVRKMVVENPYIPEFESEQKGMSGEPILDDNILRSRWLEARDKAVSQADKLAGAGVHHGIVNRLLEPFSWTQQLITSTQWGNFFYLRTNKNSFSAMRTIAKMMLRCYLDSVPKYNDGWHIPFEPEGNMPLLDKLMIATARCARISYKLTNSSNEENLQLAHRLVRDGHWSPFGHCCTPGEGGNLSGWRQFRKLFDNECVPNSAITEEWLK
jgi:hypothetical protein